MSFGKNIDHTDSFDFTGFMIEMENLENFVGVYTAAGHSNQSYKEFHDECMELQKNMTELRELKLKLYVLKKKKSEEAATALNEFRASEDTIFLMNLLQKYRDEFEKEVLPIENELKNKQQAQDVKLKRAKELLVTIKKPVDMGVSFIEDIESSFDRTK